MGVLKLDGKYLCEGEEVHKHLSFYDTISFDDDTAIVPCKGLHHYYDEYSQQMTIPDWVTYKIDFVGKITSKVGYLQVSLEPVFIPSGTRFIIARKYNERRGYYEGYVNLTMYKLRSQELKLYLLVHFNSGWTDSVWNVHKHTDTPVNE